MELLGHRVRYVCLPRPKTADLLTNNPALALAVVSVLCNNEDHDDNYNGNE